MKKIFFIQWGLSDYDMPLYSCYLYADSIEHAKTRAIVEKDVHEEMMVEEITVK